MNMERTLTFVDWCLLSDEHQEAFAKARKSGAIRILRTSPDLMTVWFVLASEDWVPHEGLF